MNFANREEVTRLLASVSVWRAPFGEAMIPYCLSSGARNQTSGHPAVPPIAHG